MKSEATDTRRHVNGRTATGMATGHRFPSPGTGSGGARDRTVGGSVGVMSLRYGSVRVELVLKTPKAAIVDVPMSRREGRVCF